MGWTATKFSVVPLPCGWLHLCAGEKTGTSLSTPPSRPPFWSSSRLDFFEGRILAGPAKTKTRPFLHLPVSSLDLLSILVVTSPKLALSQTSLKRNFPIRSSILGNLVNRLPFRLAYSLCKLPLPNRPLGEAPLFVRSPLPRSLSGLSSKTKPASQTEHSPVCCSLFPL